MPPHARSGQAGALAVGTREGRRTVVVVVVLAAGAGVVVELGRHRNVLGASTFQRTGGGKVQEDKELDNWRMLSSRSAFARTGQPVPPRRDPWPLSSWSGRQPVHGDCSGPGDGGPSGACGPGIQQHTARGLGACAYKLVGANASRRSAPCRHLKPCSPPAAAGLWLVQTACSREPLQRWKARESRRASVFKHQPASPQPLASTRSSLREACRRARPGAYQDAPQPLRA